MTTLAACVVINDWRDATSASEHIVRLAEIQDYQPGKFYRRELLCIQAVLRSLPASQLRRPIVP